MSPRSSASSLSAENFIGEVFTDVDVESAQKDIMPTPNGGLLDPGQWKPSSHPASPRVRARGVLGTIIKSTRPSFLGLKSDRPAALRKTAYLDGLRGFAAFLVYILHHELWAHSGLNRADIALEQGWGWHDNHYFATLPFIRIFVTGGHIAVACFFVISGYVLSNKPMKLIHSGELLNLGDNLGSAIFRRWFRLWIPIAIVTFVYMTFLHITGLRGNHKISPTWTGEVWEWYAELKNYSFIFNTGGAPFFYLNTHVWTIPLELRGSLIVYMSCLSFSRFERNARLTAELAVIFYFMWICDGWYCAYFMAGMLLCDLDNLAESGNLPKFFYRLEDVKELIWYSIFMISMYLAGVPCQSNDLEDIRSVPGWYLLSFLKPQAAFDPKWFYLFWAAMGFVTVIPRIPWLKSFFECNFCQHLGRISFAFYLAHGPVLWLLGGRLYTAVGLVRENLDEQEFPGWPNKFPLPRIGPLGFELNFLAVHLITLPLTLWLGDVITRAIDEPVVRLANSTWKKMLPQQPPTVQTPLRTDARTSRTYGEKGAFSA